MIRPLKDRVFLTPVPRAQTSAAGIHLVETDEAETVCDVVAVGADATAVKPGDRVVIAPMSGIEASFDHGTEQYIILGENEILAVLE